jgi:hypothetical protein
VSFFELEPDGFSSTQAGAEDVELPTFLVPVLFCVERPTNMTRLILTSQSGFSLGRTDLADVVIPFTFRFVWGPLPSPDELATYLAARSDDHAPGYSLVGLCRPLASCHQGSQGFRISRVLPAL